MITPQELTGEMVKTIRTQHKWTRQRFQDACGIGGASVARLCNIEAKNSWKSGDRERVAAVINEILGNTSPTDAQLDAVGGVDWDRNDAGNVLTPAEAAAEGLSNVDSQESQTGAHHGAPIPDPDPFAASRRFLTEVKAEYAPPVPVWCDDDESDVDDENLIAVEKLPVIPASSITVRSLEDMLGTTDMDLELSESDMDLLDESVLREFTVTNSLVQTAKRCKRKWWLGWYRGLAPRYENLLDVRSTGTRIHRALQAWYVPEGETPTNPRDALERVLVEDWTRIKTAAEERGHDEFVLADLTDKFQKVAALERAMIEGYVQWLEETGADANLKIIDSETQVRVHLYDHVRADGEVTPVHAMGLLDVRAYRTTDGARLFVDHKTVGNLKQPVAQLPMNEQMLHYHLLEWLSTSDGEERCDGALYNMIRRVKRTAAANPPFFDRYEVRHNTHELENYRRRLIAESRDIMRMIETLDAGADPMDVAYPTPTKDCSWDCDFFSVCSMFDDGSRAEDAVAGLFHVVDPNARYEPTKGSE